MSTKDSKNTDNKENQEDKNRREPLDASHGKDRIEIEKKEAKRLNDMSTFAPMDGDLGDESRERGDESSQERKNQNVYDPAMGTGSSQNTGAQPGYDDTKISEKKNAGITAHEEDSYVDEDGKKKIAPEKRKNQEDVQNPGNKKES
ncbi:MAG TPA: hypothetical protein VJ949_06780 [Cryomorphaceae bacterium]|nr:hypothetical protein [Cryomorphaceae bacterium]